MKKLVNDRRSNKSKAKFEFTLSNFAKYYENDKIIIESFYRLIKYKIENEFCENIVTINDIKINQYKNDLIVEVFYRKEEE